jgi:Gpi18-like mannosyltransferase
MLRSSVFLQTISFLAKKVWDPARTRMRMIAPTGWAERAPRQHDDCIGGYGVPVQRTMSNPLTNPWLAPERLSVLFLPITGLAVAVTLLPLGASNYDMWNFFVPWMNAVQDRGLASLSGDFAAYTPPHIYLMYVASGLVPWIGTVAAIKLINLPFIAILSLAIYHIVLIASENRKRAATAAALFWIAPTPLVIAFAWGQFECLYAAFLALFVLFAIKRAPIAAASMFGVSLAFKPQAIFLLPLLLYLILAKQMRVWHLVFLPITYLLMMAPAAIAGRGWLDLVNSVYVGPFEALSMLAVNAPNPWKIVGGLQLVDYRTGLLVGTAAAGLGGLFISVGALRLEPNARTVVLVAALSGALMPYLLPKMHERYFFVADIMTFTLAFVIPRLWITAPLFQVGSLLSYLPYLGLPVHGPILGILPVTFGVGILALAFVSAQVASRVTLRDVVHRFGGVAGERPVGSVT